MLKKALFVCFGLLVGGGGCQAMDGANPIATMDAATLCKQAITPDSSKSRVHHLKERAFCLLEAETCPFQKEKLLAVILTIHFYYATKGCSYIAQTLLDQYLALVNTERSRSMSTSSDGRYSPASAGSMSD